MRPTFYLYWTIPKLISLAKQLCNVTRNCFHQVIHHQKINIKKAPDPKYCHKKKRREFQKLEEIFPGWKFFHHGQIVSLKFGAIKKGVNDNMEGVESEKHLKQSSNTANRHSSEYIVAIGSDKRAVGLPTCLWVSIFHVVSHICTGCASCGN